MAEFLFRATDDVGCGLVSLAVFVFVIPEIKRLDKARGSNVYMSRKRRLGSHRPN